MKDTFITRLGAGNYFGGYDIGHGEVLWFVGYDIGGRVRTLGASRDLTADYSLQAVKQLTSEMGSTGAAGHRRHEPFRRPSRRQPATAQDSNHG